MKKLLSRNDLNCRSWAVMLFLTLAILTNRGYGQNSTAIDFAQFAHGGTGTLFQTTFQLFNSSNQALSVSIKIFQDNGNPFNVGLNDVVTGNSLSPDSPGVFTVTIPGLGIKVLSSYGAQALQTGWAQLTSASNQLNANVLFQQTDASGNILAQTAVPGVQPSSSFSGLLEKSATVNTGVAFANPSLTATALATLTITNPDGSFFGPSQTVSVPPSHHVSGYITDFFPQFTGFGILSITSDNNLVGLFLRQDHSELTTLPLFRAVLFPPNLLSVSPPDGAAYATVTITGTNFDSSNPANNQVILGNQAASVVSATSTTLVVTVPQGLPPGPLSFVVTTTGGISNSLRFTVDAGVSTPVITSLYPNTAQAGSGPIQVVITGRNFGLPQDGASVTFGTATPAFQLTDSTSAVMIVTTDLLTHAGTVPVVFSNPILTPFGPGKVSSDPVNFTITRNVVISSPTITGINPTSGQRGQVVTISGTNFDSTSNSNNVVRFGNAVASFVAGPVLPNSLAVIVPSGVSNGALTVTVTTNGLISNGVSFTVVAAPPLRLITVGQTPVGVAFDSLTNQAVVTNYSDSTATFVNVYTGATKTALTAGGPLGIDLYTPPVVSDLTPRLAVIANAQTYTPGKLLSFLNLDTAALFQIYDYSFQLTTSPWSVAVDQNSGIALVSNFRDQVFVVDLATLHITKYYYASTGYWVGVYHPSPSVDIFGVTNFTAGFLTVYDLQTDAMLANIEVGTSPAGFAINPITGIGVVANSGDNTISIIDMNSLTNVGTVPVGVRPYQVAIDSVRNRAVVSNSADGTISVVDLNPPYTVHSVITTLSTGGTLPEGVALSMNANLAIVANSNDGNIAVIPLP
jgi:YVTN family beta-propeller protein